MTSQPVTDTPSTSDDPDHPDQDGEPAPLTAFDGPEWERFAARFLTSRPCERPYRSEW